MRFPLNVSRLVVPLLALLLTLLAAPVAAQTPCDSHAGRLADINTREQLKQFVHCAAAHVEAVGWQQAALDFETSDWLDGPVSLFASKTSGEHLFAFDADIAPGDSLWQLQDSDGVYVVQEQARIAQDFGGGYVYYRFNNPASGQEEYKESYVLLLNYQGEPAFIGAGLHPQDTHGTCSPDTVRATLVYTERDVERFVACAAHHLQSIGLQAIHDFNNDLRWNAGPTYLFLFDQQTLLMVANPGQPHLVGTFRTPPPDRQGRVLAVPELQRILNIHDDGYVYYPYRNPVTEETGRKIAYARRVLLDGRAYTLASGLYVPSDECRALPLARDIDTREELQQFVRCAAQLVEERGELAFDLFLNHPQWLGGSVYLFVLDEQCRQLATGQDLVDEGPAGCDFVDIEGTPVDQNIRATVTSEAGEGWISYVLQNPVSGQVEGKNSYVVGVMLNGELISVAAGLYESDMQE